VLRLSSSLNMEIPMLSIMHPLTSMNYNFLLFGVFWFPHFLYFGKRLLRTDSLLLVKIYWKIQIRRERRQLNCRLKSQLMVENVFKRGCVPNIYLLEMGYVHCLFLCYIKFVSRLSFMGTLTGAFTRAWS